MSERLKERDRWWERGKVKPCGPLSMAIVPAEAREGGWKCRPCQREKK